MCMRYTVFLQSVNFVKYKINTMKNLISKVSAFVITWVIVISCSKEGPQGPAGKDGTNGNANVMYSDWITYVANFDNIATLKSMNVTVDQYTNGFVDSGGFYLGFIKWQENVQYQLPYEARFNSVSDPIVQMKVFGGSATNSGTLRFTINRQDWGNIQTNFTNLITNQQLKVRYFLIKGTTNLRLKNGMSIQDYYKAKSYEEICALTGAKP